MQNNLRKLRRQASLTQIELAQKSGVPRSRIQLAEAGTLELRPEELHAIREAVRPELARTAELLVAELGMIDRYQGCLLGQGDLGLPVKRQESNHE